MTNTSFKVMIIYYKQLANGDLVMIKEYALKTNLAVINANDITAEEQNRLIKDYKITRETINYALDKFERPRISYTEATDSYLMVISIPSFKDDLAKMVQSVTIIVNDQNIICFTNKYSQHIMGYIGKFFNQDQQLSHVAFQLFAYLIHRISDEFLDIVKHFYDQQEKIEVAFHKRSKRAATIKTLAELQSKITFGLTATSGNENLVGQIRAFFKMPNNKLKMDHNLRQQLESARIESNQALKDFQLINDIVQQLSGTYNNILNNDTNDVMRYLTVYSLILTIPTIVVGFYGMNMHLPLADGKWAWLYALIITIALTAILIIDMIRRHFL